MSYICMFHRVEGVNYGRIEFTESNPVSLLFSSETPDLNQD